MLVQKIPFIPTALVVGSVRAYRGNFMVENRYDHNALVSEASSARNKAIHANSPEDCEDQDELTMGTPKTLEKGLVSASLACTVTSHDVYHSPLFFGEAFQVVCDDVTKDGTLVTAEVVTRQLDTMAKVEKVWDISGPAGAEQQKSTTPGELRRRHSSRAQYETRSGLNGAIQDSSHPVDRAEGNGPGSRILEHRRDMSSPITQRQSNFTLPEHALTGVDRLQAEGVLGTGVRVAMIDSGFDYKGVEGLSKTKIDYTVNLITGDVDPWAKGGTCISTHGTWTLGIIGANSDDKRLGLVGVAPEATYSLYGTSTCTGGIESVSQYAGMWLTVAERGYDIITTSLGGWPNFDRGPLPDILRRIVENGTFVSFPTGNSPAQIFESVAGPGAEGVTGSGSYDGLEYTVYTWGTNATSSNGTDLSLRYVPGYPYRPEVNNTLSLWWPDRTGISNDNYNAGLCDPLPAGTVIPADPANTILLIPLGRCYSSPDDATNTSFVTTKLGIPYTIYHNTLSRTQLTWLEAGDYMGDDDLKALKGLIDISKEDGDALIELVKAGPVELSLPTNPADGDERVDVRTNTYSGGYMNRATGWGPPTTGSELVPRVSSPGSGILGALPAYLFGFGSGLGTSAASPFTAGVAALVRQMNPTLTAKQVSHRLSHTATPVKFMDKDAAKYEFLGPVFSQGGGLINAYAAVRETTLINVGSLSFNDTLNRPASLSFEVHNTAEETLTYVITHEPAASGYIAREDRPDLTTLAVAYPVYAEISISAASITLGPGAKGNVSVSVVADPPLNETQARGSYFGGYIALTTPASTVRVPYTGFGAPLTTIKGIYFDLSVTRAIARNDSVVEEITSGHIFSCRFNGNATSASETPVTCGDDGLFPGLAWEWSVASPQWSVDVIKADSGETLVADVLTGGVDSFWFSSTVFYWPPVFPQNKTIVPEGSYAFQIRALTMNGDSDNPEHYAVWKSEPWTIQHCQVRSLLDCLLAPNRVNPKMDRATWL